MPSTASADTICEGWLRKRGRLNTAFKMRWMQLKTGRLDYFAGSASGNTLVHKGSIYLGGAQVSAAGPLGISVRAGERTYALEARSDEDHRKWLAALLDAGMMSRREPPTTPQKPAPFVRDFSESEVTPSPPQSKRGSSQASVGDDDDDDSLRMADAVRDDSLLSAAAAAARQRSVQTQQLMGLNLHGNLLAAADAPTPSPPPRTPPQPSAQPTVTTFSTSGPSVVLAGKGRLVWLPVDDVDAWVIAAIERIDGAATYRATRLHAPDGVSLVQTLTEVEVGAMLPVRCEPALVTRSLLTPSLIFSHLFTHLLSGERRARRAR